MRFALVCAFLFACGSSPKKTNPTPSPSPSPSPSETPVTNKDGGGESKPAPDTAKGGTKTLYDRLGGLDAIKAVVEEFVGRTTTDPRIKDRFFNTDATKLKQFLVELVCNATGGPCKYTGRDMKTSHAGMDLVDEDFNALVEDLKGALDKFKVPDKEQGELLGALAGMKPLMVVPAGTLKPIDDAKLAAVTKLAATLKQKDAQDLLATAVIAGKRGQRSYAEQLFSRAEMITGPKPLASVAATFRAGAPTRVTTATKKMEDKGPQSEAVGNSEVDNPVKKPEKGSLEGTLKIDGKGPQVIGVVMLWPAKGGGKKRIAKDRVMEQRDKTFEPHVMAVPVGSTVSFPNFDPIFHNVFSLSKVKSFDLGMYKNGETREVKFDKPGILRLGCNLHANMSAFVIVVDAPHYAVVSPDGKFSFKSLAPGKYKVQAWTERSGEPVTSEVTIADGANTKDFDLKAGAGPAISPDKFGAERAH